MYRKILAVVILASVSLGSWQLWAPRTPASKRLLGMLSCHGDPYLPETACHIVTTFVFDGNAWKHCEPGDVPAKAKWTACHEAFEGGSFEWTATSGACMEEVPPAARNLYQGDERGKGGSISLKAGDRSISIPTAIVSGGGCRDPRRWTMAWPPPPPGDAARRLHDTIDRHFSARGITLDFVKNAAPREDDDTLASLVWGLDPDLKRRLFGVIDAKDVVDLGDGDFQLLSGTDLDEDGDAEIFLVAHDWAKDHPAKAFRLLDGRFRMLVPH